MKRINELKARMDEILDEFEILEEKLANADESTPDHSDIVAALTEEFDSAKAEVEKYEAYRSDINARLDLRRAASSEAAEPIQPEPQVEEVVNVIPATVKSQKSKHFASSEDAFVSGMFLASLTGSQRANEILAAQSIGTDNKGGFTVPDPLSNSLINLLEEYGVARRDCRRVVMSADTWTVPKVAAHAAVSYPSEAGAISETDVTFSQVQLVAKKIAALVKMSTEVTEDSVISMMDTVVQSIAYAIAIAEDANLFNGVAGGINTAGIKGDAGVFDVNVASVSALALDDLTAATVGIGNPIVGARNEWYLNSTLYNGPIRDLVNAVGGATMGDIAAGSKPTLLGYPVNYVSVLPGSSASVSGDLLAVFGDLSLGCYFGDRRALNFKVLNELYAENDQVGVQCTERVDEIVANPEVLSKITLT